MKHLITDTGQQHFEAMRKAHDDKTTIGKAMVPDINRMSYDQVMKAFDAETDKTLYTPDAIKYIEGLTKEPKGGSRVLEFVGSTERRDRDGDRIKVSGWDMKIWKTNPAFSWAHNYAGFPPAVGLKAWKETGGDKPALMFHILFPDDLESEDAQKMVDMVFAYYASKPPMLKAVSVGFLPTKAKFPESDEEREKLDLGQWGIYVEKAELWELGGCLIGSNYDALKKMATKAHGAKGGGSILDAMGIPVTSGKTTVDFSGIDGTVVDPESGPSITGNTSTGVDLDGIELFLSAKAGNPEALKDITDELTDRVRKGEVAKSLLTFFEATDLETGEEPEPTEEEPKPDENQPETDEEEPSQPESEDPEMPDDIPAEIADDVYLDLGIEDEESDETEEEENPSEDEPFADLILEDEEDEPGDSE